MRFGISTQIFRTQTLNVDLLETLRRAGYEHIELFCNRPHLDFHNRRLMRGIGRWFRENALPPPAIHLPFVENVGPAQRIWISVVEPERRHREAAVDEIKRSLELSDDIPISHAVLHLGNPHEPFNPVAFEYGYSAIMQIRAFSGVDVLVENIPNGFSTLERIEEFRTASQLADLGVCFDSGHANLEAASPAFDAIRATHLHDNQGERDEHLWPFDGSINWPALIEKFVSAKYDGALTFEARGEDLSKGGEVKSRLQELWDEAQNSLEEFRLKYSLESTA